MSVATSSLLTSSQATSVSSDSSATRDALAATVEAQEMLMAPCRCVLCIGSLVENGEQVLAVKAVERVVFNVLAHCR
jgi:hypothetical protein